MKLKQLKNIVTMAMVLFVSLQLLLPMSAMAAGPKKSDYKRILNEYCNTYLSSCFDGIVYVDRSVWIHDVSPFNQSSVLIEGIFSYRDYNNKRHRAVKFQAIIETKETEVQRITFKLLRPADMTHTQPYWDECARVFGAKEREAMLLQEMKRYAQLLDNFCTSNYSQCFSGRSYTKKSIRVNKIEDDGEGTVVVYGTHTYRGRTNTEYRDYKFEAKIITEGERLYIEFNKESAPDLLHGSPYWEKCKKAY